MARFVLVHGAFGGAWCWEPVTPGLEAAGHTVETPDLPGSGNDHTPVAQVTLDAYSDRVCEALAARGERAVLVGHSMGGVVITQAAARRPDLIDRLVYVCAFLPQDGQSLGELVSTPEGAGDKVQANMVVEGEPPVAILRGGGALEACFGSCTQEQAAWGEERMGPQPVTPFGAPVSLPDGDGSFAALRRGYVVCTLDQAIPPALQRRMLEAARCDMVAELETDHSPFLSKPAELVAILDTFASA